MSVAQRDRLSFHCEQHGPVTLAWIFTDARSDGFAASFDAFLSPAERERAAAHRCPVDQASYRAAHALKRLILAERLGCTPTDLRFDRGPFGKPYLCGDERLHFSLSHTAGLAVFACAFDRTVGVDAEPLTAAPIDADMAAIAFHPEECATVATLPVPAQAAAWLDYWVLREAYAKATGRGLTDGPNDICLALDPPRILRGCQPDERWHLSLRRTGASHLIALAVADDGRNAMNRVRT